MTFAVGDKVVYPHHGAAIIEGKEKRVFDGQKTDYFVLRITYGDLKVSIPVDKADEIGLRDVINDEEVEEVFAVLRKKEARMPTNWSRRFKNHVEKLKSGDIYQVAEVVRNLSIREADKGLSAGEKRMLARARQILVVGADLRPQRRRGDRRGSPRRRARRSRRPHVAEEEGAGEEGPGEEGGGREGPSHEGRAAAKAAPAKAAAAKAAAAEGHRGQGGAGQEGRREGRDDQAGGEVADRARARARIGTVGAVVVAAGRGDRFGAPKQFLELDGARLVDRAVTARAALADDEVVVVLPAEHCVGRRPLSHAAVGGRRHPLGLRARRAGRACRRRVDVVVVHDAARPLASRGALRRGDRRGAGRRRRRGAGRPGRRHAEARRRRRAWSRRSTATIARRRADAAGVPAPRRCVPRTRAAATPPTTPRSWRPRADVWWWCRAMPTTSR